MQAWVLGWRFSVGERMASTGAVTWGTYGTGQVSDVTDTSNTFMFSGSPQEVAIFSE